MRSFERGGQAFYLAADATTLTTRLYPASQLKVTPGTLTQSLAKLSNSAYSRAIAAAQQQSNSLQDAGIAHGFPKEKGISLTIDLCPSHKPLDRVIFTSLINAFKKVKTPVPVALSITGRFMLTHGDDIEWLKGLQNTGDLDITWINHTYNHHFNPRIPLKENFLLEPGTDVNFEVLGTETAMLQHGLTPSVFFRFPGLVSDHSLVEKITDYGLIPVGSDAWLAKGQNAASGSIVLIHGNGNEPVGVKDFIKLLSTQTPEIMNKQWLLYDLSETVEDEFSLNHR
ncbi:polysaccharide deacetylase [Mucilaginibacter sp. CSA2-8R]|uniref:polysaccharide deacetylase family protein n=1 Tax=Mucilaginibacter sp. CSA2-8R TaxID=3141542 RepID=UPI00315D812E